jgi:hypothetical protein
MNYTAPSNAKEVVDAILETAVTRVLTPEELETVKTSIHELSTTRFRRLVPAEPTEEGSAPVTARPVLASSSGTKRKRGIDKEGIEERKGLAGLKTTLEKLALLKSIKADYSGVHAASFCR